MQKGNVIKASGEEAMVRFLRSVLYEDTEEDRRLFQSRLHRVWWYENGRR